MQSTTKAGIGTVCNSVNLKVLAAYHQLFLLDGEVAPQYPEVISDEHLAQGFQFVDCLLAIYTQVDSTVAVRVLVSEGSSPVHDRDSARIFDCEVDFPSGTLIVAGISDKLSACPSIPVPKGRCTVQVQGHDLGIEDRERYDVRVSRA